MMWSSWRTATAHGSIGKIICRLSSSNLMCSLAWKNAMKENLVSPSRSICIRPVSDTERGISLSPIITLFRRQAISHSYDLLHERGLLYCGAQSWHIVKYPLDGDRGSLTSKEHNTAAKWILRKLTNFSRRNARESCSFSAWTQNAVGRMCG